MKKFFLSSFLTKYFLAASPEVKTFSKYFFNPIFFKKFTTFSLGLGAFVKRIKFFLLLIDYLKLQLN